MTLEIGFTIGYHGEPYFATRNEAGESTRVTWAGRLVDVDFFWPGCPLPSNEYLKSLLKNDFEDVASIQTTASGLLLLAASLPDGFIIREHREKLGWWGLILKRESGRHAKFISCSKGILWQGFSKSNYNTVRITSTHGNVLRYVGELPPVEN
jgi:hypothetical protein